MSGNDAQSDIEIEFDGAVKTASAYLRALGVFELWGISQEEHRKHETKAIWKAIRKDWNQAIELPAHPLARHAATLGSEYLHGGHNPKILKTLLEKDCTHPAYREALNIVASELRKSQKDIPKKLQRWEKERGKVKGRWTVKRTRDYLIGLVVEAMATGQNCFFRYGDLVRLQLEQDLRRVYAEKGNPPGGLLTNDIVKALNGMSRSPWKKRNDGKGLTESKLSKLLKQGSSGELHRIAPETKVRTCFPNLRLKRGHLAKRKYSICDAVAKALEKENQTISAEAVVSARERYKKQPIL